MSNISLPHIEKDIDNLVLICELMLNELRCIKRRRYYRDYYQKKKKEMNKRVIENNAKLKLIEPKPKKEYIIHFD